MQAEKPEIELTMEEKIELPDGVGLGVYIGFRSGMVGF